MLYGDVKKAFDSLDDEVVRHPAIQIQLLLYGVAGVVHAYLCRALLAGEVSAGKFYRKYEVRRETVMQERLLAMPLRALRRDGIYFPRKAGVNAVLQKPGRTRRVIMFFGDYLNQFITHSGFALEPRYQYALNLVTRQGGAGDFKNKRLLEQGLRFGRELWAFSVEGFERERKGRRMKPSRFRALSSGATRTCRKLISYYSGIVEAAPEA